MDMLTMFRDLYASQVATLNKNREDMNAADATVYKLREELRIAEFNVARLQADRDQLIVAAKGTLQTYRNLDDNNTARRKAEEWETLR